MPIKSFPPKQCEEIAAALSDAPAAGMQKSDCIAVSVFSCGAADGAGCHMHTPKLCADFSQRTDACGAAVVYDGGEVDPQQKSEGKQAILSELKPQKAVGEDGILSDLASHAVATQIVRNFQHLGLDALAPVMTHRRITEITDISNADLVDAAIQEAMASLEISTSKAPVGEG